MTAAVLTTIFWRVIFLGEIFVGRDTFRVYYPLRKILAERLSAGEFPEWNPYSNFGEPFVPELFSSVFHPSTLLYLLMPLTPALAVNVLLCFPLAVTGTFLCARLLKLGRLPSLFAGVTFAFSGYLVGITNNLSYLIAAASMPLVLWAAEVSLRRATAGRVTLAVLGLASVLFTGDVQTFLVTCTAVLMLSLVAPLREGSTRLQRVLKAGGILGVTALVAAVQLLPAWYTRQEARQGHETIAIAQMFAFNPLRLLEFFFGPAFVFPEGGVNARVGVGLDTVRQSVWSNGSDLGPLVAVFGFAALVAARRRLFAGALAFAAAVAFALSLGPLTPLYRWAFDHVPIWNALRYPEKLLPFWLFPLSLGAAFALQAVARPGPLRRWVSFALLAASAIVALLTLTELTHESWTSLLRSMGVYNWQVLERLSSSFVFNGLAATAVLGFGAVILRMRHNRYRLEWILALQCLWLGYTHMRLPETGPVSLIEEPSPFIAELQNRGTGLGGYRVSGRAFIHDVYGKEMGFNEFRAFALTVSLEPILPALFGIEGADYYLPASTGRATEALQIPEWDAKLAPLYSVRYRTVSTAVYDIWVERGYQLMGALNRFDVALIETPAACQLLRPGS